MSNDDDRPKRSWRELDRMRDGSGHQRDTPRSPRREERMQSSSAYRQYKTQLNRLFDGGVMPEAVKGKLQEAGVGSEAKTRKEAGRAIIDAKPAKVLALLGEYREAYDFPEDEEVLAKLLDLDDEEIVVETIETIGRLRQEGALKRANSLKARIRTAMMTVDDPEVQSAGKRVLELL